MNDPHPFDELIVATLLEHPVTERPAFLEHLCAGDTTLRAHLAALTHARSADVLASLAPCRTWSNHVTPIPC